MKIDTITKGMALAVLSISFLSVNLNAQAQDICTSIAGVGAGAIEDKPAGGGACGLPGGAPLDITFDFSAALPNLITTVQFTDLALTHTWIGDLQAVLISPDASVVSIFNKTGSTTAAGCGDSSDGFGTSWQFSDAGTKDIATEAAAAGGATDVCAASCDFMASAGDAGAPAPATPPTTATFAGFSGGAGNGIWTLRVWDSGVGDTGDINSATLEVCVDPLLPVELAEFYGMSTKNGIDLHWSTISELNNSGFEVQIQDGSDWRALAFVQGEGTSSETQNYSFSVRDLDYGTHGFRLKQIDFDGVSSLSEELEVAYELVEGFDLNAFYPNPFNPSGSFTILLAESQEVSVDVYNTMGRLVRSLYHGEIERQQRKRIEFNASSGVPSGNYLIKITGEYFHATQKVSLVK